MKKIMMTSAVLSVLFGAHSAFASVEIRIQNDSGKAIEVELGTKGFFCTPKYGKAGIVSFGHTQSLSVRSGCQITQLVVKELRPDPNYSYHFDAVTTVIPFNQKLKDGIYEWSYKSHNNVEPQNDAARSVRR